MSSDWFVRSREGILQAFGEDDFDLFCRILAGTSPIHSIEDNVDRAVRVYRCLKLDGKLTRGGLIGTHFATVRKFLDGRTERGDIGRKVWSLYQNLIGNEQVCPVDRWILRYYGWGQRDLERYPWAYDVIELGIRLEAMVLGISPAQRQCAIWCESRGDPTNYGDVLRRKGITKESILRRLL